MRVVLGFGFNTGGVSGDRLPFSLCFCLDRLRSRADVEVAHILDCRHADINRFLGIRFEDHSHVARITEHLVSTGDIDPHVGIELHADISRVLPECLLGRVGQGVSKRPYVEDNLVDLVVVILEVLEALVPLSLDYLNRSHSGGGHAALELFVYPLDFSIPRKAVLFLLFLSGSSVGVAEVDVGLYFSRNFLLVE